MRPAVVASVIVLGCNGIAGLDALSFDASGTGGGGASGLGGSGGTTTCAPAFERDIDNCGAPGVACPVRAHAVPACVDCTCTNQCDPGWDDCDGEPANGCETQVSDDPQNCGGCGVDCRGADCVEARCDALPFAVGQADPWDVAVVGERVYWINEGGGELRSCPVDGCTVDGGERMAGTGGSAFYLSTDNSFIYWNNNNMGELYRCGVNGCDDKPLKLVDTMSPTRSTVDDAFLYWHSNDGNIRRAAKDGSAPPTIMSSVAGNSGEVAVDGAYLYWTSRSLDQVARCDLDNCEGATQVLVGSLDTPQGMAIDKTHVYFGESGGGDDLFARIPKAGGAVETLKDNAQGVHRVRLTESHAYWVEGGAGGAYRIQKAGGEVETLLDGLEGPRSVAVGAGYVFVADTGAGIIYRLPVPD